MLAIKTRLNIAAYVRIGRRSQKIQPLGALRHFCKSSIASEDASSSRCRVSDTTFPPTTTHMPQPFSKPLGPPHGPGPPTAMASPSPPPRPLRLLCLHGYRQSAGAFRARTGALRKALGRPLPPPPGAGTPGQGGAAAGASPESGGEGLAELIYIDAPFLVPREGGPPLPSLSPPPPPPSPAATVAAGEAAAPVAGAGAAVAAPTPAAAPQTLQRSWGLPVR